MSEDQRKLANTLSLLATHFAESGRIEKIFGVAGDPITPLISFCESTKKISYYGFRNEQAASFAASIISCLTCRKSVGVCLTVAGPGFTNALTGLANACTNEWPMIHVCPLVDSPGEFQSVDQLAIVSATPSVCRGYVVYNQTLESVNLAVQMAVELKGAVVIFVPSIYPISGKSSLFHPSVTRSKKFESIPTISVSSNRPIVVMGSMAPMWSDKSIDKVRAFIESKGIPFFADPMGRGVIPESHVLCVSAARSRAIGTASLAIVVGGKIDWMLHHGKSPKWSRDCQFLVCSSEDHIDEYLGKYLKAINVDTKWREELVQLVKKKKQNLLTRLKSPIDVSTLPNHWQAIGSVKRAIERFQMTNSIIVSEGANTMDVCRVALDGISLPRKRLDSGRWGTMGIGLGFVVAACALNPNEIVIAIEGDSALGFSGMELETISRYKCRCIIIVFNNGGIYTGSRENATAFGADVCHAKLMDSLGGYGISSREIGCEEALLKAFNSPPRYPVLVDLIIDPSSGTASGSLSRM